MDFPKQDPIYREETPFVPPNYREGTSTIPPGFRFHPTDEELLSYYLMEKVMDGSLDFQAIGEVDFNKCEPWDLPEKANYGQQSSFYFFSLRDRKYPTGMRTNRATEAGYWKATGKDRAVIAKSTRHILGMKKTLVFYTGRAPKGQRTNWIMHEYRLEGESKPHQQEWVVCRVFEKSVLPKRPLVESSHSNQSFNSEYNAAQLPDPFLPPLQTLDSPRLVYSVMPTSMYAGHNITMAGSPVYNNQGTMPPVDLDRRSNSSIRVKRELQFDDGVESYMLPGGWDTSTSDPLQWDGVHRN